MKTTTNYLKAVLLLLLITIVSCTQEPPKEVQTPPPPVDSPEPLEAEITEQDVENLYTMQYLSMLNVLTEIKAGRAEQLAMSIEKSLPVHMENMSQFKESNFKTVAFYSTGNYYIKYKKSIPENFVTTVKLANSNISKALSKDCYDLLDICIEPGCRTLPTTLRPIDKSKPNPSGFRYVIGSNCAYKWWRFWNPGCGPELNGLMCTESVSDAQSPSQTNK